MKRWMTLRQHGVALTTGPFGTVLAASEYVHGGVPLINPTHIRAGGFVPDPDISVSAGTAERLTRHALRAGDIVVGRHGDVGRSALVRAEQSGWLCGGGSIAIRPGPTIEPRFLQWALTSRDARDQLLAASLGATMDTINEPILMSLRVWSPPVESQQAIADYLDTETARIDALIAKKQRMIEILTERQSEYQRHIVTGGVSYESEGRKETGNALVPLIPPNWELVRARFLCEVGTGSSDTDESADDGTYPFFVRSQTPQSSNRYILDTEAVLTAGDGAGVGKVFHHFIGRFDAHQRVYVLHRFRRVTGRFFFYYFSAYFGIAALDGSAKSTVDSVRRHMITEMPVVVPPLEEQQRLVHMLDLARERAEALVLRLQEQLELLREHRQALITTAVTGELVIPGVAA